MGCPSSPCARRAMPLVLAMVAAAATTPARAELPALSVGGFGRMDVLLGDISDSRDLPGDNLLHVPNIPVSGQASLESSRANAHLKNSRAWVRAVAETGLGTVEAYVEGDMAGSADRYERRLRHAYLIVGQLLVGQSWTVFTSTSALADIEAGFGVGNVITRHDQIRWTQPLGDATTLTLAAEEPLNRLHVEGTDRLVSSSRDRRPDMVMRLDRTGGWGDVSVGLAVREIATIASLVPASETDSETGVAVNVSGRLALGVADNLRFSFKYGDALARHIQAGYFADATVTADGRVDPTSTQSGLIAYQHFWAPRWRSTLAASYTDNDANAVTSRALTRRSRSAHANLIWTPTPRLSFGIEYLYAWRQLFGGEQGDLNRINMTTRFNF